MKLNNFKIILSVVFILIVAFVFINVAPKIFLRIGDFLTPSPLNPEVQYYEFPFRLIYELDGKEIIVEDSVICEYDGIQSLGEAGKYRKWKSKLKSGNERITLLKVNDSMEFYFDYGNPENYMGDPQSGRYSDDLKYDLSYIPYIKTEKGKQITNSALPADEVWKNYNLRILDWKYTKPIKNNFN